MMDMTVVLSILAGFVSGSISRFVRSSTCLINYRRVVLAVQVVLQVVHPADCSTSLVVGHMRVGVVGGVSVGGHLMRQGSGVGHGGSGGHMVGNGWGIGRSGMDHGGSGVGNHSGSGVVHSGAGLVDDGVEAIVVIGGVLHGAHRTIGLHQGVGSLDDITITHLVLRLHVSGVRVSHSVVVVVLGVGLRIGVKIP